MPRNRRGSKQTKNSTKAMVTQVQRPFTATAPGRTRVRVAGECLNVDTGTPVSRNLVLSYAGFNSWSSRLRAICQPFDQFRVVDVTLSVYVAGGAASPYTIYAAVSMGTLTDSSVTAVLDEDASLVATAGRPGTVHLGPDYWRNRTRAWFLAQDTGPNADIVAGNMAY